MNVLFAIQGFASRHQGQIPTGPPYRPHVGAFAKGTIEQTYRETEEFRRVPHSIRLLVKLPPGYDGPEIDPRYLVDRDLKEYCDSLDGNDV
ncbi:hypothetical protein C8035_v004015 [Colletotrichum spinosum]|uniref:Uncharacterized protein n=1 Tax=Colletotrichum spinosum TaxID=1347390 RepID=A0A4R8PVE6_9PEZI|nr:hypothetical protein C8035_v004015 [Colletotrichum spinosum]